MTQVVGGGRKTMRTGKKELLISTADQLRALRTPVRQDLVRALTRTGPRTVRELAQALGRQPAALYYHVHALVKAGIVVEKRTRGAGERPERVYALAAPRIRIDRSQRSKAFLSALDDLQRATLSAAERELSAQLEARGRDTNNDHTSLLRLTSRLRPNDAKRASEMLKKVAAFIAEKDDPEDGSTYSLTAAFTHLVE
jgi:predicted ArsR family transcriptional regulator